MLLVYDVTNEQSFQNVATWYRDIKQAATESLSVILVGNKADLAAKRVVSSERGKELAKEWGIDFFEASAKENQNVDESFLAVAKKVVANKNYLSNNIPDKPATFSAPVPVQNKGCCG